VHTSHACIFVPDKDDNADAARTAGVVNNNPIHEPVVSFDLCSDESYNVKFLARYTRCYPML
jgi:hypothetical protein